jgi:hypothetical protein
VRPRIRYLALAVVVVACRSTAIDDDHLSSFREGELITGRVVENLTACEVDAICSLQLTFSDTTILAIYGTGERPEPTCQSPVGVSNVAFTLKPGELVDVVVESCDQELLVQQLARRVATSSARDAVREPPGELTALLAKADLADSVLASCATEFTAGVQSFAVATGHGPQGGRYLVVEPDATVHALAEFVAGAEVSCYSPEEAAALHATIAESETIAGEVRPLHETGTVCGFVNSTDAVCWQYSPADRAVVRVGGWTT